LDFSAMPRQSYLKIVGRAKAGEIDIGPNGLGKHPEIELIIGRCIMAWSSVEIEMAMILGHLIGAKDAAAIAVFSQLRRSSAQRDAIMEAARIVLNAIDLELLTAFLNVHKAIETERNSLAHGHFGTSSLIKDGLLWMNNSDYVFVKSNMALTPGKKPPLNEILSKIYVYRIGDLTKIYEDICWMISGWYDFLEYLSGNIEAAHDQQYRQLCDRPRIAQELVLLRQKNNSRAPT
jgi:hypothetical protein